MDKDLDDHHKDFSLLWAANVQQRYSAYHYERPGTGPRTPGPEFRPRVRTRKRTDSDIQDFWILGVLGAGGVQNRPPGPSPGPPGRPAVRSHFGSSHVGVSAGTVMHVVASVALVVACMPWTWQAAKAAEQTAQMKMEHFFIGDKGIAARACVAAESAQHG